MQPIRQLLATVLCAAVSLCGWEALAADPPGAGSGRLVQRIDARDLKTLHYMENAHGQLEEWSLRLLSRLELGRGPRDSDPILDGRADLQVKKLAITYASYTKNPQLADALRRLAAAHGQRLAALQSMVAEGPDRERYLALDREVQLIAQQLRSLE